MPESEVISIVWRLHGSEILHGCLHIVWIRVIRVYKYEELLRELIFFSDGWESWLLPVWQAHCYSFLLNHWVAVCNCLEPE